MVESWNRPGDAHTVRIKYWHVNTVRIYFFRSLWKTNCGSQTQRIALAGYVAYRWGMRTHADIINQWPSLRAFAEDLGISYVNAQVMRYRDSIPVDHWARVIKVASNRGFDGISWESLDATRPRKRPKKDEARAV